MRRFIDGILVVEGKSDVAYLSNYFNCEFVTTNGSEIPANTIKYLQNASKNKKIIVLTDPDSPGKRIRDILDQNIPNLSHCFIEKSHAIKGKKVGVAECDIDEINRALSNELIMKSNPKYSISMNDLCYLGLVGNNKSSLRREYIADKLNLGFGNAKTFLKRLNSQGITKDIIEDLLNEQN